MSRKALAIPAQFEVFGAVYRVLFDPELLARTGDHKAEADLLRRSIRLQPPTADYDPPGDVIEVAFCHELLHHLLHAVGYDELSDDEAFVEVLARALHQVLVTWEGAA